MMLNVTRSPCGGDFQPVDARFAHCKPKDIRPCSRFFRAPLCFDAEFVRLLRKQEHELEVRHVKPWVQSPTMGSRSASMQTAAGTHTRSNGAGYTVTMTISAKEQVTGSDTQGCVFNGTVSVPFPSHNSYGMNTVPTGTNNLFMYSMSNARMGMTDSFAR